MIYWREMPSELHSRIGSPLFLERIGKRCAKVDECLERAKLKSCTPAVVKSGKGSADLSTDAEIQSSTPRSAFDSLWSGKEHMASVSDPHHMGAGLPVKLIRCEVEISVCRQGECVPSEHSLRG